SLSIDQTPRNSRHAPGSRPAGRRRFGIRRRSDNGESLTGPTRTLGRRLATKGTKSTKGRSSSVVLPFVPFVANLLPSVSPHIRVIRGFLVVVPLDVVMHRLACNEH